jgi:hypothetical protein
VHSNININIEKYEGKKEEQDAPDDKLSDNVQPDLLIRNRPGSCQLHKY